MKTTEENILEDIKKCEDFINNNFATREDLDGLIAKYRNLNPKFGSNIVYFVEIPGHTSNYASKMKIIKSELEGLLLVNKTLNNSSSTLNSSVVNNYIYNTQNQNNQNNISLNDYHELDQLVDKIKKTLSNIDDEELKIEISDNVEGLQEELKKDPPRKGIIKSISNSLKKVITKIPKAVEVALAITELVNLAQDWLKQLP